MELATYYVYIYLDPRKPGSHQYGNYLFSYEPFYVGKGSNGRMFVHVEDAKHDKHRSPRINKIKAILNSDLFPVIEKVKDGLTEKVALEEEEKLIRLIGRMELGTGPLTNQTFGGDGVSGEGLTAEQRKERFGREYSEVTRAKIGNRHYPTGKGHHNWNGQLYETLSQEAKDRMKFHGPHSEDAKKKIGTALNGTRKPEGFSAKIAELKKGNTNVRGKKIHTVEGMRSRTRRMVEKTIEVLNSKKLEFNEINFDECRLHSNYPQFSSVSRVFTSIELCKLLDPALTVTA